MRIFIISLLVLAIYLAVGLYFGITRN